MVAPRLRVLGIGEVIDAGIAVYRRRFSHLLRAVAVVIVPIQVLALLVQISLPADDVSGTTSSGTIAGPSSTTIGVQLAGILVIFLVSVVGAALAEAAALRTAADGYLEVDTTWGESLRFGLARWRPVLGLTLLRGVILVAGFAACGIPGIWLYVVFSVAIPALLLEDLRPATALSRSSELVRRRWWATGVTLLLVRLLILVLSTVMSAVLVPIVLSDASETATQTANAAVSALVSVLTTPLLVAVVMAIYFDLRVRKEGFDLALMARDVGVAPPGGGFAPPPPGAAAPWAIGSYLVPSGSMPVGSYDPGAPARREPAERRSPPSVSIDGPAREPAEHAPWVRDATPPDDETPRRPE